LPDEGKYLYGIIATDEARNFGPIGIGGRGDEVGTIAYRDLSAVVSNSPMTRYVLGKENLLAHERVIERVMKEFTVLPVRFCTVAANAEEIRRLVGKVEQRGYTLIPLDLHYGKGRIKLQLALAKGKLKHDKRASEREKEWQREKSRLLRPR